MKLVAGSLECQEFLPSTRWPMSTLKKLGNASVGLPAEVEDGNSAKFSNESPEGLRVRQDDP